MLKQLCSYDTWIQKLCLHLSFLYWMELKTKRVEYYLLSKRKLVFCLLGVMIACDKNIYNIFVMQFISVFRIKYLFYAVFFLILFCRAHGILTTQWLVPFYISLIWRMYRMWTNALTWIPSTTDNVFHSIFSNTQINNVNKVNRYVVLLLVFISLEQKRRHGRKLNIFYRLLDEKSK